VAEDNIPRPMDAHPARCIYDELKNKSKRKIKFKTRRTTMLTTIIVILLILWLLGFFGPGVYSGIPATGNAVHTLLVIALILIVLRVLGIV
jgi:hypothetical protein